MKIKLPIQEDVISLNTGAIAQLIQKEDEQEVDALLCGLLDVVPSLPLNKDDLNVFLTTLKSIVPDIDIKLNLGDDFQNASDDEFYNDDSEIDNIKEKIENGVFDFDSLEAINKSPKVKLDSQTHE